MQNATRLIDQLSNFLMRLNDYFYILKMLDSIGQINGSSKHFLKSSFYTLPIENVQVGIVCFLPATMLRLVLMGALVALTLAAPQEAPHWLNMDGPASTDDILKFQPMTSFDDLWKYFKMEHSQCCFLACAFEIFCWLMFINGFLACLMPSMILLS